MVNKWNYKQKLKEAQSWNMPKSEKEAIKEYAKEYSVGRITRKVPNKPDATITAALSRIKLPLENINKSFDNAVFEPDKSIKDYDKQLKQYRKDKKVFISDESLKLFVDNLLQNKFKVQVEKWIKEKGIKELKKVDIKDYTNTGKDRILEYLRTYIKFRFENKPVEEARLLKFLNVRLDTKQQEPKTLTKEELKLLITEADLENECYIRANSRGGFRGGEFHSIEMQGVRIPDLSKGEKWVEIDIIKSKTKNRTIKIYKPEDIKVISEYYKRRLSKGAKQTDLFFPKSHATMRQWLRRVSLRVLKKAVYPHMLRATAVTLNAEDGLITNDTDMNKFYGWVPGTGTSARYLNMSKISLKNVDKNAENLLNQDYQERLQEIEFKNNLEIESFKEKIKQIPDLKKQSEILWKELEHFREAFRMMWEGKKIKYVAGKINYP